MNRPKGLQKEEIFLLSRILRIVDTYDVMFYGRPYKPKLSQEEVFNKLETGSGSKYDPNLSKRFIEFLDNYN